MRTATVAWFVSLAFLSGAVHGGETNLCQYFHVPGTVDVVRLFFAETGEESDLKQSRISVVDTQNISQVVAFLKSITVERIEPAVQNTTHQPKWRIILASRHESGKDELGEGIAVPRIVTINLVGETILDRRGTALHLAESKTVQDMCIFLESLRLCPRETKDDGKTPTDP